jgi:hypothetical protein
MFIDKERHQNYTPSLISVYQDQVRAVHETPFDGVSYIVVTTTEILRVKPSGAKTTLHTILTTGMDVDITENNKNQVTIVDGKTAYVIEQQNSDNVVELSPSQSFPLLNPISCATINNFTVILDGNTGQWVISDANNAISYADFAVAIQVIDGSLSKAIAVRSINNNIFIFGTTGIERYEPTLNVNIYLFPLQKDMNFKINFGAISTSSVVANINTIYFLSSRFIPISLDAKGFSELLPDNGQNERDESGIAREIASYPDVKEAKGAFYTFLGNFFYQLTFETSAKTWVYCINSKTFANIDDYIIGAAFNTPYVITSDGLYSLSTVPAYKKRLWISEDIEIKKGQQPSQGLVNGGELFLTQGSEQPVRDDYIGLSLSLDRRTWTNNVTARIGNTGDFNYRTIWPCNIACRFVKLRTQYYGTYPLTIEGFELNLI